MRVSAWDSVREAWKGGVEAGASTACRGQWAKCSPRCRRGTRSWGRDGRSMSGYPPRRMERGGPSRGGLTRRRPRLAARRSGGCGPVAATLQFVNHRRPGGRAGPSSICQLEHGSAKGFGPRDSKQLGTRIALRPSPLRPAVAANLYRSTREHHTSCAKARVAGAGEAWCHAHTPGGAAAPLRQDLAAGAPGVQAHTGTS